ncbi:hypothetical protein CQW39_20600 [Streptomyces griseofuscus]|uniref:LGFP repeat-containing protein n=1 Tax=Streptomyces griseofuscus TaxID=146922 RepID=UPI000F653F0B|nr:DUF2599 domain-containing protein [Streptomyces griseofuscus]RRQ76755.1 hypothetical protein CQW39_20600 [Streptomyces griseofuscus]
MHSSLGRIGTLLAAPIVALGLVTAGLTIGATSASAEVFCGSHSVDGAIWTEYTQTPGVQRSLGCPTTDELGTPDGVGRFQAFDNGSIYWTPDTGAHAVWGAIRQHWADLGWERGYLGYPLTDEITNPDGYGVRQQFQGGTIYWSQYSGAHAVHGLTGWWWGQNGYESGFYGYPTSDEYNEENVGGDEDNNTGVRQNFQSGRYILYSGGQSNAFESCHTACIGYGGITNTKWVKKTEVYMNLADQNKRSTHVTPTDAAFASTSNSDTASSDSADDWKQVWSNTLMFPHATQGAMHSTYEQLYCHASYSYPNGSGGHRGGPTWDLEAWHYDMVPYDASKALQTGCNWGE